MEEDYRIDATLFWDRVHKLYDSWKGERGAGGLWHAVDALVIDTGKYDEEASMFLKSTAMQNWLFSLELPDTVLVFAETMAYVLASTKKVAILEQLQARRPNNAPISVLCFTRNKADSDAANYATLCSKVTGSFQGKTVATFIKETPKGTMVAAWRAALSDTGVAHVDLAPMAAHLLACKDDAEQALVKRAAFFGSQLVANYLVPEIEDIAEEKKEVKHSKIATDLEDLVEKPDLLNRLKIPQQKIPDPGSLDLCYTPIIQSGGEYSLKPSAESNDKALHCHVITVSVGGRYRSYCTNVGRTYLINATKDQQRQYDLLLKAQEAAIAALKPGEPASSVLLAAQDLVRAKDQSLLPNLTTNVGFATGLEFRDASFVLNAKNQKPVRENMVLIVSVGFDQLKNPGASDPKARVYAMFLSDTVLVGHDGPETLTSKCRRDWDDVSYELDDEEPQRPVGKENVPRVPAGLPKVEITESRTRAKNQQAAHQAVDEKLMEHQKELEIALRREGLRRLNQQVDDYEGSMHERTAIPTAYASPHEYPRDMTYTQTYVDAKAEAVLVPIYGTMVPFHISMIKNVTKSEEGSYTYLRINFNAPGQGLATAKEAAASMERFKGADSIREITLRARDPRNLNTAFRLIKELRTRVMRRDKEEEEKRGLVEQEQLRMLSGQRVHRLRDVNMRPNPSGRKSQGVLELQANGVRYTSNKGERVDITFRNMRNFFFQPAQKEHIVLIHFHLKNGIMIGKKQQTDVQFFVEVIDQSYALDQARRGGYDPDELEEEQRERALRRKMNEEFQRFAKHMEEQASGTISLELDIPYRELGFTGVVNRTTSTIMPTVNALVELIEPPWLVVNIEDIEIVHFERVVFGLRNFDMVIAFKDLNRDPVAITTIDSQSIDSIKTWLDSCNIKFYEGVANLNWGQIMKTIRDDPVGFYEADAWNFLDMQGGGTSDSEEEDDDDESEFEPEADDDEEEEDDDEEDDDDDEDFDDEESEEEASLDSDESSGKDWDELEEEAVKQDGKRNAEERGGNAAKRKVDSAGNHKKPVPPKKLKK